MRIRRILFAFFVASLLVASSCPQKEEANRQLNSQTKKAGAFVETKATDPAVKQAGTDIRKNSETLEKNVFGPPKEDKDYTPPASAAARTDSDKAADEPWYKTLWAYIGYGAAGVLTVLGGILRFAPGLLSAIPIFGQVFGILQWVSGLIQSLHQGADNQGDDKLHKDGVVRTLSAALDSAPPIIKHFLEDKLKGILPQGKGGGGGNA